MVDWKKAKARAEAMTAPERTEIKEWLFGESREAGDTFVGIFDSMANYTDKKTGEERQFAILKNEDGEACGLNINPSLQRQFEIASPKKGDMLAIKFFGMQETKNGREVKVFGVEKL